MGTRDLFEGFAPLLTQIEHERVVRKPKASKPKRVKESTIEAHLVKRVRALGGKAYKWVSPGTAGVPDRIVILPGRPAAFVELKAKDGRVSPNQQKQITHLRGMGQPVFVLWSIADVDAFLDA